MIRFITILLALVMTIESLVPLMEVSELSKLPALWEHYQKHRSENPGMSLLSFLQLHYENPNHHNQDHQTHDSLPFSATHGTHHHNGSFVHLSLTAPSFTVIDRGPALEISLPEYTDPFTSSFSVSIWQPPKAA
jgi:hypothetical protein